MRGEVAEQIAKELLLEVIPGGAVEEVAPRDGADFVFHIPRGDSLIVEVKAMGAPRVNDLIGRLATAVLQLTTSAAQGQLPLAIVVLDQLGQRSLDAAATFMRQHGRGVAWAVLDGRGNYKIHVPGLIEGSASGRTHAAAPSRSNRLFTDLNQWLLKILVLRKSPPQSFPGKWRGVANHPSALSELAEVSHQKAYDFVHVMEQRRLIRNRGGLHVTDFDRLSADWLHHAVRAPMDRVWVRSALGLGARPTIAEAHASGVELAVGGFEACRALGLLHTASVPAPDVHVRDVNAAVKSMAVASCDRRDADLALVRTRDRRSVFRGVQPLGGLPVVDVIQAALDVASHKARGLEQAEHIFEQVREWNKA